MSILVCLSQCAVSKVGFLKPEFTGNHEHCFHQQSKLCVHHQYHSVLLTLFWIPLEGVYFHVLDNFTHFLGGTDFTVTTLHVVELVMVTSPTLSPNTLWFSWILWSTDSLVTVPDSWLIRSCSEDLTLGETLSKVAVRVLCYLPAYIMTICFLGRLDS